MKLLVALISAIACSMSLDLGFHLHGGKTLAVAIASAIVVVPLIETWWKS